MHGINMIYQQKKDKIKIYTLNDCVYCILTKKMLKEKNISYDEIKLEQNLNLFDEMKKKYKYNNFPLIFIN